MKGVDSAVSGYIGGATKNPTYEQASKPDPRTWTWCNRSDSLNVHPRTPL